MPWLPPRHIISGHNGHPQRCKLGAKPGTVAGLCLPYSPHPQRCDKMRMTWPRGQQRIGVKKRGDVVAPDEYGALKLPCGSRMGRAQPRAGGLRNTRAPSRVWRDTRWKPEVSLRREMAMSRTPSNLQPGAPGNRENFTSRSGAPGVTIPKRGRRPRRGVGDGQVRLGDCHSQVSLILDGLRRPISPETLATAPPPTGPD